MIRWGRLRAALFGADPRGKAALDRGRAEVELAHRLVGSAARPVVDRAIAALETARRAGAGPEAVGLLAYALIRKSHLSPPEDRPALRARCLAMLKAELAKTLTPAQRRSLLGYESSAWMPDDSIAADSPQALARLTRARDAQALALACCDRAADPQIWCGIMLDLARIDWQLLEHPLCPDRSARIALVKAAAADVLAAAPWPAQHDQTDSAQWMLRCMIDMSGG